MTEPTTTRGSAAEVFAVFLRLGLTSFGGPVAHLGYFREELVVRRGWLTESDYADLVALCQFLPGPASSQVGFALGMLRAGWPGALAAFLGFTLPSALVLTGLALGSVAGGLPPVLAAALVGLKIVAVAVVAQAVLGMARSLCPDAPRATIAVAAVALLAVLPGTAGMLAAIGLGALAGLALGRGAASTGTMPPLPVTRGQALVAAGLLGLGLLALPLLSGQGQALAMADAFFRAGALVFGGGHVVLPLLEAGTVGTGWVTAPDFLAGYGAAQAVPGPLFTFAAWLGAVSGPAPNGVAGAALALAALFLPGFLVLVAALPFWDRLRRLTAAQSAMQGANAAVVGILGAALYDPVFTAAIGSMADLALALGCFVALVAWRLPPWAVVLGAAAGGVLLQGL
jgi:chromate transporter